MIEIRFHGREGQGTVVAFVILAKAFFKSGYYVQTFPVFGVERRGAPVEAYLKTQGRFKHLTDQDTEQIQKTVDEDFDLLRRKAGQ